MSGQRMGESEPIARNQNRRVRQEQGRVDSCMERISIACENRLMSRFVSITFTLTSLGETQDYSYRFCALAFCTIKISPRVDGQVKSKIALDYLYSNR